MDMNKAQKMLEKSLRYYEAYKETSRSSINIFFDTITAQELGYIVDTLKARPEFIDVVAHINNDFMELTLFWECKKKAIVVYDSNDYVEVEPDNTKTTLLDNGTILPTNMNKFAGCVGSLV